MYKFKNLEGLIFGNLAVIELVEESYFLNHGMFLCICDCGEERIVSGHQLTGDIVKCCKTCQSERENIPITEQFRYNLDRIILRMNFIN